MRMRVKGEGERSWGGKAARTVASTSLEPWEPPIATLVVLIVAVVVVTLRHTQPLNVGK